MAYIKYDLCIIISQFISVQTSSRAAHRCVVWKWKCAQNVSVCCDVEDGNLWWNGQQQWRCTDSSPKLWVDDLLPTYFTSPRPSACRLLPKTFAATIPLSDFGLSKNRLREAEGESVCVRERERQNTCRLPTSPRLPAPAQQGGGRTHKCRSVHACQANNTISRQRSTNPTLE